MAEKKNPKTGKKRATGYDSNQQKTNLRRIKGKPIMGQRNLDYLKPKRFKNYMTLTELCMHIEVDQSWVRRLEAQGRIPQAQRVPMGKLMIRLWSPAQVEEIRSIIEGHKVGRPPNS